MIFERLPAAAMEACCLSVFRHQQALARHTELERHLNATAKSHAASCTKGHVLQMPTCIGEKGIATATAGP